MLNLNGDKVNDAETADSHWKGLYRIGGVTAMITAMLLPIEIIIFAVWPQPSTIIGWFTLLQNNRLLGLLDLDLLGIFAYALLVPTILALYVSLHRASESFMAIAAVLYFIGITVYFASNTIFSMLFLSDQYAAATTEAQKSLFLAAGQAMITFFSFTAFQESYVIVSVALLIISTVMLRSLIFSKSTAYAGILANASALGAVALEHTPVIGSYLSFIAFLYLASIVPLTIWYVLIAHKLLQLGKGISTEEGNQN